LFGRPAWHHEDHGTPLMKLLSISVGPPRDVEWRGKTVRTSIFKSPVPGPVRVRRLNLEGDQQSDLSVHGGAEKAVCSTPVKAIF
jgi:MOSC domain-containing protein YiiM